MADKYPKRPRDPNQLAKLIVDIAVGQEAESPPRSTIARGRPGGLKGGKARAEKLSADKRSAIAKKAAAVRWSKESS
jgi:hypothetical protein